MLLKVIFNDAKPNHFTAELGELIVISTIFIYGNKLIQPIAFDVMFYVLPICLYMYIQGLMIDSSHSVWDPLTSEVEVTRKYFPKSESCPYLVLDSLTSHSGDFHLNLGVM